MAPLGPLGNKHRHGNTPKRLSNFTKLIGTSEVTQEQVPSRGQPLVRSDGEADVVYGSKSLVKTLGCQGSDFLDKTGLHNAHINPSRHGPGGAAGLQPRARGFDPPQMTKGAARDLGGMTPPHRGPSTPSNVHARQRAGSRWVTPPLECVWLKSQLPIAMGKGLHVETPPTQPKTGSRVTFVEGPLPKTCPRQLPF
jgi:hypothetical protein